MNKPASTQDFIRGRAGHQNRVLNLVGLTSVVVVVAVLIGMFGVYPHFATSDAQKLQLDVQEVGPGVAVGTKVMLRGAPVGTVTDLEPMDAGVVKISLELDNDQTRGLTDAIAFDYSPENYFGATAINLHAKEGGNALRSGDTLTRAPAGEFTMSTMLEQASIVVDGTLTDSMISSLNKVFDYTDGLTPLLEVGIVVADQVAKTQKAMPSELLGRMDDITAVFPDFNREVADSLFRLFDSVYNRLPNGERGLDEQLLDYTDETLVLVSDNFFGQAGALLASHGAELTPTVGLVKELSDVLPDVLGNGTMAKVGNVIDRYQSAFSKNGNDRTLNLRLALDDMPALAQTLAPYGAQGRQTAGVR